MKKWLLLIPVIVSLNVNAQKLKDLLYSGKLKSDSGTVVHKEDDLSTKIDSNAKKRADSIAKARTEQSRETNTLVKGSTDSLTSEGQTVTAITEPAAPKDNNVIWKEYMDSMVTTIKTDILPDKKIKSGTYYILVDYVIEPDGQVTINNVFPSPENKNLQQQLKERLVLTVPRLNPVIGGNGQPRRAIKKYNFSVKKD